MPLYITTEFQQLLPVGTVALIDAETKARAFELLAAECAKIGIPPVPRRYIYRVPEAPGAAVIFSQRGY